MRLVVFPSDPIDDYIKAGLSCEYLADYFNPAGIFDEVLCLSPWKTSVTKLGKVKCIQARPWQYKGIIEKFHPDIVRGYGGYCCADWVSISKVRNIPTMISLHDTNPKLIYDSVVYADCIVCMSEAVKNAAIKKLDLQDKKIWVMPNRIDTDLFSNKMDKMRFDELNKKFGGGKHIIHVGRKTAQKNLDTVIRALTFLTDDYKVIFIGEGDDRPYRELADKLNVANRCFFVGRVEHSDLPYWYSWCDCMCTPSRWEGFGFVFIEAAACKTSIVTSNIGPMNEYLDKESAILVDEYERPEAIANAITKATSNTAEINSMKNRAREVGMKFAKETVDQQEIDIYINAMKITANNKTGNRIKTLLKYRSFK